jgi:hypothetical protein
MEIIVVQLLKEPKIKIKIKSTNTKKEKYNERREYKEEKIENSNDHIYFRGKITIIDKWFEYSEIYIVGRDGEEIKARISKNELWKIDDRVTASCKNYVSGFYRDCRIRRAY